MCTWSFLYYDILESGILNEKNKTVSFWEICVWIEKENDYWKSRKKRNLQKNNKEEYLYNTNHHINKIEKKHWSNYY